MLYYFVYIYIYIYIYIYAPDHHTRVFLATTVRTVMARRPENKI